jgi:hypothetical protein
MTIMIGGDQIQVSRNGEAYILSMDDESVQASVDSKSVELEKDGQTIKLPKDGGRLKISLGGELVEHMGKPQRNDEETKLEKNASAPSALPKRSGEQIRPKKTIKRSDLELRFVPKI